MSHEPRCLVGHAERPMKLVSRNALLAGGHEPERQRPFMQRDMARFHDRASCYSERAFTRVAVKQPGPVRFAAKPINALSFATVGTNGSIRPAERLEVLPRFGFIGEDRIGQVHGGLSLSAAESNARPNLCQRDNCRKNDRPPWRRHKVVIMLCCGPSSSLERRSDIWR